MTARDCLKQGKVSDAHTALLAEVRAAPTDPGLRWSLFDVSSLLGAWAKALTQLELLSQIDPENAPAVGIYRQIIECEILRAEVFAGRRTPLIFGQPEPWLAGMVESLRLQAGDPAAAGNLRAESLGQAPPVAAVVNGERFENLADGDTRLGPVLEVIMNGRYYWVPFARIHALSLDPPKNLRDLIWAKAQLTWVNGGAIAGVIPVRYPGIETSTDDELRMARKTDWLSPVEGDFFGLGQRTFLAGERDLALLELREAVLADLEPQPEPPQEEA